MRRVLMLSRMILLAIVALLVVIYAGDFLTLRFRRERFGTVEVQRMYAMRLKNNRTQFTPAETISQECVHSLFPHSRTVPCWYLERHRTQQIEVDFGALPGRI